MVRALAGRCAGGDQAETGDSAMATDHGNSAEIAAWNGPLGRTWVDWQAAFDAVLGPIGAGTLARADVRGGERGIDVGRGGGGATGGRRQTGRTQRIGDRR